MQVSGAEDMSLMCGVVTAARNDLVRHGGYYPNQWVLGIKGPRVPGALLDDHESGRLAVLQAAEEPDGQMAKTIRMREAARMSYIQADASAR
eukprot:6484561-Amphidinium_carterae.1